MFSSPTPLDLAPRSCSASRARQELNGSRLQTSSHFHARTGRSEQHGSYQDASIRAHDIIKPWPLVSIAPSENVERRTVGWSDNMYADLVQSTEHGRVEFRFRAPVHLLVAYERGARRGGQSCVDGLPPSSLRDLTRKLTLVPAGYQFIEWHEPRILPRISYFYFDQAALAAQSERAAATTNFAPRLLFEDTALWDSALRLRGAIETANCDNRLYVDALAVIVAHELTRLNSATPEPPLRGGLAGWQQRNVTAYIEEHLADQIQLSTLAGIARLSPYHFCRAFKRSTGLPPHRYHATRRIERAKGMLAKRSMSVTEVGFALGFAQTSSFTAAFRRVTGTTPTEYQRTLD
jgi:AraC family transcriptional regulator